MTLMVKEILTIAIGTIIASGFAFYFFGAKDNPSVTLEYRYSNFGLELVVAADRYLDDAVQQQVASARSVGDLGGNVKFDWLVSSLADVSFSSFPLSQYKAIENLIVTNTDRNREARIRIRGLNCRVPAGCAVI